MIVSINGPAWFYTIDSVFQILFAVVMLLIAGFSYNAYRLTEERKYKYFSAGFFMAALGFLFISFSNLLVYLGIYDGILGRFNDLNVANLIYFIHIALVLTGYTLLLVVAMKLQQRRLIALLFSFLFLFALFSYQYYLKFHVISFMLLAFMAWQFFENYREKKTLNAGLVFSSFYLLALAEIFLLAMIVIPTLYVVGHAVQLLGYGLLLAVFVSVEKQARKSR